MLWFCNLSIFINKLEHAYEFLKKSLFFCEIILFDIDILELFSKGSNQKILKN